MDSKLTLQMDKLLIEEVKQYAKYQNISLSLLVKMYFRSLVDQKKVFEPTPLVKSLSGIVPRDVDLASYRDHLAHKYQ